MSATPKSSSASRAAASRCSTVLVEPPIATSRATAFSNAARVAIARGSTESSSLVVVALGQVDDRARRPRSNSALRAAWVASVEPLPGRARPIASVRQFIELAVNMPEQEPQVGQAERSICAELLVGDRVVGRRRSSRRSGRACSCTTPSMATVLPASIGPPETKTVGMFSRSAASSMPGRDLVAVGDADQGVGAVRVDHVLDRVGDQLAAGQRVEHAAVAHGDAVVDGDGVELAADAAGLGDRVGDQAAEVLAGARGPGTNWVKLLAMATIGLPKSSSVIPVARHRARAPAMFRPCVEVRERSSGMPQVWHSSERAAQLRRYCVHIAGRCRSGATVAQRVSLCVSTLAAQLVTWTSPWGSRSPCWRAC